MRPSPLAIALVLALTALSVLVAVLLRDGAGMVAPLWGGMAAAALLDLALTVPGRSIDLTADLPATGHNGRDVRLVVTAKSPRLPAQVTLHLFTDPGLGHAPQTIEAGQFTSTTPLNLRLKSRGIKRVYQLILTYPSRLRLFEIITRRDSDLAVKSLPDTGPIQSGEITAQMLPLIEGARSSKLKGEGSEFHQLRDYVQGMDPRSIDWKRSARFRALVSRETRAERNHQIILCLDKGHLMTERLGDLSRLDHALNASLALAFAASLGGDNVGLFSFAARPGAFIPPRSGRAGYGRIQSAAADLEQSPVETNHTLGLSTLSGVLRRRSLVVMFSDFVDTTSAELMVENLAVLQRQHLVLYIALNDPALIAAATPPAGRAMGFDDLALSLSARQMLQDCQIVLDRLRRLGILCLDATPKGLSAALISRYIEIKSKEMI
jgi:uncharacterized protein (DUF58 family)